MNELPVDSFTSRTNLQVRHRVCPPGAAFHRPVGPSARVRRVRLTIMTRDALLKEALKLPVKDRADVAAELLASLDDQPLEDPDEVAKAWAAEIERRGRRVLAGESAGVPWEAVRRRLEERLARQ